MTAVGRDHQAFLLNVHDSAAPAGLMTSSGDYLITVEIHLPAAAWIVHISVVPVGGERTVLTGTVI